MINSERIWVQTIIIHIRRELLPVFLALYRAISDRDPVLLPLEQILPLIVGLFQGLLDR
ncbi:hypothetical protein [Nostoc sp. FACHB-892]|uniref:hypothetical protein n=1 Tax=Nostoc sp. FACHB-892 TaxID=2692843 RepID=UPI001A7EDA44|nr:hypothetical protein [Nostoc sp. FACHB-892]